MTVSDWADELPQTLDAITVTVPPELFVVAEMVLVLELPTQPEGKVHA